MMRMSTCTNKQSRIRVYYLSLRIAMLSAVRRAATIASGLRRKAKPTVDSGDFKNIFI